MVEHTQYQRSPLPLNFWAKFNKDLKVPERNGLLSTSGKTAQVNKS